MMGRVDPSRQLVAQIWFRKAHRWYFEEHQGCPRCRSRHCVFRERWGSRIEYYCTGCDLSTGFDELTGTYVATIDEMPSGEIHSSLPDLPPSLGPQTV